MAKDHRIQRIRLHFCKVEAPIWGGTEKGMEIAVKDPPEGGVFAGIELGCGISMRVMYAVPGEVEAVPARDSRLVTGFTKEEVRMVGPSLERKGFSVQLTGTAPDMLVTGDGLEIRELWRRLGDSYFGHGRYKLPDAVEVREVSTCAGVSAS